ncbi:MAG: M55 family metallopeptidase [Oscillospiraceae bacterium]|nr:M55 family metallopeptidase [Oscillospiraceae bacterium]
MEGISGIDTAEMVESDSPSREYTRQRLMVDVNAAIDGAFAGGADKVYVWDGHGSGVNFIEGELDTRAIQIPLRNINPDELAYIDAFMLVGTHAMSGTQNAFLDHTQTSIHFHDYYINGRRYGEIGQYAVYAGYFDIPVVMLTGDEAACHEARMFLGDVAVAPVKYAVERNKAILYDIDKTSETIRNAAIAGMQKIYKIKPHKPIFPIEVKIKFNRADYCDSWCPQFNFERIDARTARKIVHKLTKFHDLLY